MLTSITALSMLRTNRLILARAVEAGRGDARLQFEGATYIADLERRVQNGELDGEAAVADASRVARALSQTSAHRERRAERRPS